MLPKLQWGRKYNVKAAIVTPSHYNVSAFGKHRTIWSPDSQSWDPNSQAQDISVWLHLGYCSPPHNRWNWHFQHQKIWKRAVLRLHLLWPFTPGLPCPHLVILQDPGWLSSLQAQSHSCSFLPPLWWFTIKPSHQRNQNSCCWVGLNLVQKRRNVSKFLRICLQNPESSGGAQDEEHLPCGGGWGPRHVQEAFHCDGGG